MYFITKKQVKPIFVTNMLQYKKTLANQTYLYYNIIVGKDTFAVSIHLGGEKMRKFLALVLAVILSVGTISTVANAAKFKDVSASDETLTKAVDLLTSVGITTGTSETAYGTSEGVTRQQMATFIYRLMNAGKTVEGKAGDNITTFTDLDDPFYYFMISWANDMGIIKGRSETSFDPKGGITLQDAYVMIVRALGYEKKETLAYPYDYINVAERIGLDVGLPSSVNYTKSLTRGNVAILLYNAFYADMATGTTAYDSHYEEVELPSGLIDIVETGKTPYTVYDTVAEKIFGVKKTVQRVVATPNYSLDGYDQTDSKVNDTDMVLLECYDKEYADTDTGLFPMEIEASSLGILENTDDYFLIDFSIYYKHDEGKDPEIISATALGSRTKSIQSTNVKFETSQTDYMYVKANGNSEARFKAFTGKVSINGKTAYIFDAPWSYSKPDDLRDKDENCITFISLGASERDPEDEEYVPDFNFKSDTDTMGRGAEYYAGLSADMYVKQGSKYTKKESYTLGEKDLRGVGLYTSHGLFLSVITDLHNNENFEVDVWDSNGDGKFEYMWMKPYAMGQIEIDEGDPFIERHNNEDITNLDNWGPIYEAKEVPTIYAYGAHFKDGEQPLDDMVAIGYFNGPANYMKISSLTELKYSTFSFDGKKGTGNNEPILNGSRKDIWGQAAKMIGIPTPQGGRQEKSAKDTKDPNKVDAFEGPYVLTYFTDDMIGAEFQIAQINGLFFHVKPAGGTLATTSNYAIIFPNTRGAYAYTQNIGVVTNGKLQLSGHMLEVMIGGQLLNVQVKPQTSATVAGNLTAPGPDGSYSLMPVTPKEPNGVYDFTPYVGKLLTYTVNSANEYIFRIAALDSHTDKSVLSGNDPDAFYTYESDADGIITSAFVKTTDNFYQFLNKDSKELQTQVAPSRYVMFSGTTRVVIKTFDEDGNPVFTVYSSAKMPNFDNSDTFKNIKYIVKNNPKSTNAEELVYLYAESTSGDTTIKISDVLDYRFVKAVKTVKTGENKVVYYDVYNPFKGTIEEEYEALSDSAEPTCAIGGIYSISNGYIFDEKNLGKIFELGNVATSDTNKNTVGLGLVEVGNFDEENGLLEIEGEDLLFKVDENTAITFLDYDQETITTKTAEILNSTSGTFRCGGDKNMPLLAFVASSEIEDEDEVEYAEVICIVRCNALAE